MPTLIDLLQALFVSGIIAYFTYSIMRLTAHGSLWSIEISCKPADDLCLQRDVASDCVRK